MKERPIIPMDSWSVYWCCFSTHLWDAERISVQICYQFYGSWISNFCQSMSQWYLKIQWLPCSEIIFCKIRIDDYSSELLEKVNV